MNTIDGFACLMANAISINLKQSYGFTDLWV